MDLPEKSTSLNRKSELAWMADLNDAQRSAVTHSAGPLLVIAGAGTGKTKTLASRVAWLIQNGISPERILLLTFTRRAAAEMLSRAAKVIGDQQSSRVWGGTFHAVASRLLRSHGRTIGLDPGFNVIDSEDSADLMDIIRAELGFQSSERRFPRKSTLAAIYSRVVSSRERLGDVLTKRFPWCIADQDAIRQVFEAFTKRKRQQAVLDYDDLLLYWHAMLQVPEIGKLLSSQFDHVLVDEYQDTNPIQAEIVFGMRGEKSNVMAVGDDAQAIYSFRAATVENMLNFPKQFAGTTLVRLEQNYRSVQPILTASNRLMADAPHQFAKNLYSHRKSNQAPRIITIQDETEQSGEVCRRILQKVEEGICLRDQAVLFRAGFHSDALEVELQRRNIPFVKYGGLKFVEAAHVKDMLALLRIIHNPMDEMSWHRVLNLLDGIGPAQSKRILEALGVRASDEQTLVDELTETGEADVLKHLRDCSVQIPAVAREQFAQLAHTIIQCIDQKPMPMVVVERVRSFYEPIFRKRYENPDLRIRDIEQLEQIARSYQSLESYVTDLTLDPPQSTQDYADVPLFDDDHLILSTIHSAKGCEWEIVHVLHVSDGCIPNDMSCGSEEELAEERRLLYVAMTRAKDELNLYFPLRYYAKKSGRSDRHSYAQLSRFLPPSDMQFYERIGSEVLKPEPRAPIEPSAITANVDRMLGDLWK